VKYPEFPPQARVAGNFLINEDWQREKNRTFRIDGHPRAIAHPTAPLTREIGRLSHHAHFGEEPSMVRYCFLGAFVIAACLGGISLADPRPEAEGSSRSETQAAQPAESMRPVWQVGDRWMIDTVSPLVQHHGERGAGIRHLRSRWDFEVVGRESVAAQDCFRLRVTSAAVTKKAVTVTFWVSSRTMTLIRVNLQLPTRNGVHSMTESYDFAAGQSAPVIGPIPALMVDLPFFPGEHTKSASGVFTYESRAGAGRAKQVGDVGFAFAVEQDIRPADSELRDRLAGSEVKMYQPDAVAWQVQLKDPFREVLQVWQQGLPWPVFADNGSVVTRLVSVTRRPTGR